GGARGEALLGVGRQVLVLLPFRRARRRRHLLRLLVAQAHLAALGGAQAGPLVHALGDPAALLRRQRRVAVGDLQPLLLALGIDRRPFALERRERLALRRRQRLPAHAGFAASRRRAEGRRRNGRPGRRRGRRGLGQGPHAGGERGRGRRDDSDAAAQSGRGGRPSHSAGGAF